MTGRGQPGAVPAVQPLQLEVSIVQRIGEVCRGAAGLSPADGAVLQNDDPLPRLGQGVGRRNARDPGADDADLGAKILPEWTGDPGRPGHHPQ